MDDLAPMGPERPLAALFDPRGVAVFGVGSGPGSVGGQVFRRLRAAGFRGAMLPVNPAHDTIDGVVCVPDLSQTDAVIDLAVIATPATTVPAIVEDCARAGVFHAVVLSSGFGEGGGGAAAQALRDTARRCGVRLLGPNCVGLVRPWIGMDASFLAARVPRGPLAFVTQSGALASALADWAEPHDVGFSALVSMGNMLDLGFGEVLRYFEQDAQTRAVLLYVETLHDPRGFLSALRSLCRHKPVVVLKGGRHAGGARAAQTHTGALAGGDAAFAAALERVGALRVDGLQGLMASAELLTTRTRGHGPRLAIVTNGGGAAILAADRAGDRGVTLADLSKATLDRLDRQLPAFWSRCNPADLLGTARPEDFATALSACLVDPQVDGVLTLLTPQAMTDATRAAEAVIGAARDAQKPVLAAWLGETSVEQARARLSEAGIPDFPDPESAVDGFDLLARHHDFQRKAEEVPGPEGRLPAPEVDKARQVLQTALQRGPGLLSHEELRQLLRAFHIPVTEPVLARTVSGAVAVARAMGFPVAMKLCAEGVTHKSDFGGVLLGLDGAAAIRDGFRRITERLRAADPTIRMTGVTVEPMVRLPHARELLVGISRDPVMRTTLTFGSGGTLVEVLADTAIELPPLDRLLVRRMIARTRAARLMGDWRGKPAVNMRLVEDVLLAVSALACACPELVELDLNPLLAAPDGVIVVDARARVAPVAAGQGAFDHLSIQPGPVTPDRPVTLRDGRVVRLRPVRPEDAYAVRAFLSALSPETRRRRFLGGARPDSPDLVARLTRLDHDREAALLVEDAAGRILGTTRFVLTACPDRAEFAIVVAEADHRQGIGAALLAALTEIAACYGLRRLEGMVEADNGAMTGLARYAGFAQEEFAAEPGLVLLWRDIARPGSA